MGSDEQHFSTEADGSPTGLGRYVDVSAIEPVEFAPGLGFRPVLGGSTMLNFVSFAEHTEAPHHVHVEEQIVVMLEGELDFDLDGEIRRLQKGDVVVVPPWVPHGARTADFTCLEVDVFTPPRQTLIEHARAQRDAADRGASEGV
jgi:quercetin dioxygenase-like cupin family protein